MTYITKTLRAVQTDLENVIKILEGSKRNETLEFMEIRRRVYHAMHEVTDAICVEMINEVEFMEIRRRFYHAMHGVTDAICVEMINEGGDDEDDEN